MSSPKEIRKQIRNISQELLPELLSQEFQKEQYKKLSDEIMARLSIIEKAVATTLAEINKRSKETSTFLMTESTKLSPILMTKGGKNEKS